MGLRFRDLMTDIGVECMAGPVPPGCGCTQTAKEPACTKVSQSPNPPPNRPKPGPKPSKRTPGGLEALRRQLRSELRVS